MAMLTRTLGPTRRRSRSTPTWPSTRPTRAAHLRQQGHAAKVTNDAETLKGGGGAGAAPPRAAATSPATRARRGAAASPTTSTRPRPRSSASTRRSSHTKVAPGAVNRLNVVARARLVGARRAGGAAKAGGRDRRGRQPGARRHDDDEPGRSSPRCPRPRRRPACRSRPRSPASSRARARGWPRCSSCSSSRRHLRRREGEELMGEPSWLRQLDAAADGRPARGLARRRAGGARSTHHNARTAPRRHRQARARARRGAAEDLARRGRMSTESPRSSPTGSRTPPRARSVSSSAAARRPLSSSSRSVPSRRPRCSSTSASARSRRCPPRSRTCARSTRTRSSRCCTRSPRSCRSPTSRRTAARTMRARCSSTSSARSAPRRSSPRCTSTGDMRPFEFLRRTPPEQIVAFLAEETPQTVALVIANLNASLAARVLALLPPETQADVALRIATMAETNPDVISDVERGLRVKMSSVLHAGVLQRRRHRFARRDPQPRGSLDRAQRRRGDRPSATTSSPTASASGCSPSTT